MPSQASHEGYVLQGLLGGKDGQQAIQQGQKSVFEHWTLEKSQSMHHRGARCTGRPESECHRANAFAGADWRQGDRERAACNPGTEERVRALDP